MFKTGFQEGLILLPNRSKALVLILFAGNILFNILANTSFKNSALSTSWRGFLTWQVVGNLAGFVAVLSLSGAMRFVPLHVAYPVSAGLTLIGVQVVGARWLFHETITMEQWVGTLLVLVGLVLITR